MLNRIINVLSHLLEALVDPSKLDLTNERIQIIGRWRIMRLYLLTSLSNVLISVISVTLSVLMTQLIFLIGALCCFGQAEWQWSNVCIWDLICPPAEHWDPAHFTLVCLPAYQWRLPGPLHSHCQHPSYYSPRSENRLRYRGAGPCVFATDDRSKQVHQTYGRLCIIFFCGSNDDS